ncbi:hypothetical protein NFI96_017860 [Prochilodus magdalenae]|nr:hypothetical protein NFI96_017860 [Prochilodus magdalenae]
MCAERSGAATHRKRERGRAREAGAKERNREKGGEIPQHRPRVALQENPRGGERTCSARTEVLRFQGPSQILRGAAVCRWCCTNRRTDGGHHCSLEVCSGGVGSVRIFGIRARGLRRDSDQATLCFPDKPLDHPHTVPADGAVGVELEGHQAFWTCDSKPFISVLTSVPPHTGSLGVSTKTKAGLVTEDDPLPF